MAGVANPGGSMDVESHVIVVSYLRLSGVEAHAGPYGSRMGWGQLCQLALDRYRGLNRIHGAIEHEEESISLNAYFVTAPLVSR
jgi:hypothetical protein